MIEQFMYLFKPLRALSGNKLPLSSVYSLMAHVSANQRWEEWRDQYCDRPVPAASLLPLHRFIFFYVIFFTPVCSAPSASSLLPSSSPTPPLSSVFEVIGWVLLRSPAGNFLPTRVSGASVKSIRTEDCFCSVLQRFLRHSSLSECTFKM